jgi:hypothetical protein
MACAARYLLAILAAAALAVCANSSPVEMSSSVILFGMDDFIASNKHNGMGVNWCSQILTAARQYNAKKVSIVITQYWKPTDPFGDPYDIHHFCYKRTSRGRCEPFTSAALKE